jgi:hypothetical protein
MAERRGKQTLFQLITELPYLFGELVRAELELLRKELVQRLKGTGIGLGLIAVAFSLLGLVGFLLVVSGVYALSIVLPVWAAALILAAVVLLVAILLFVIGAGLVSRTKSPVPRRTIESVREDIARIRGDRRTQRSSRNES